MSQKQIFAFLTAAAITAVTIAVIWRTPKLKEVVTGEGMKRGGAV